MPLVYAGAASDVQGCALHQIFASSVNFLRPFHGARVTYLFLPLHHPAFNPKFLQFPRRLKWDRPEQQFESGDRPVRELFALVPVSAGCAARCQTWKRRSRFAACTQLSPSLHFPRMDRTLVDFVLQNVANGRCQKEAIDIEYTISFRDTKLASECPAEIWAPGYDGKTGGAHVQS